MSDTLARYLEYTDKVILDEETGSLFQGDRIVDNSIFRFIDGKLDGGDEAAIETDDGHHEWWKNGKLHREDGPAIYCIYGGDNYDEYWENGVRVG